MPSPGRLSASLGPAFQRKLERLGAGFPGSVRWGVFALVLIAGVPLLMLQGAVYWEWFLSRREDELASNHEVARAVGATFMAYVRDVSRQNASIDAAIKLSEANYLAHARRLLQTNREEYPSINAWYLVDREGNIIAAARQELLGRHPQAAQEVLSVVMQQRTVVTDLIAQGTLGRPVFCIARRLEDEQDRVTGAVVAEIEPSKLGAATLDFERTEEGRFSLFDRRGVVVHSEPAGSRVARLTPTVDPLVIEALRERHDTEGVVEEPDDKRLRFAARVYLPELGWVAGASRPVDVAMADESQSLRWITAANLLILFLSAGGAAWIGRRIVNSLSQLETHAEELGRGELGRRVAPGGMRELAQLGGHFNQMAERLQQRSAEIEKIMNELARSNRELEQFAYVASHDLQEPLRVITGYLQLIERRYRGNLDSDGEQFITYVVEAVFRMQQLIADLLEYSRVGTRGRPFEPVAMERVLDEALAGLRKLTEETGASVEHEPLPVVLGDAGQLVQLLQNLIANALKFRREAPPEIHIAAHAEDGQVVFSVRDNGIGMEPQYWDQIFVIFQRLHTRQKYGGTGIGLAICKRIVERHGGRIWVDSVPDRGSTFYFTLRRHESSAALPDEQPTGDRAAASEV
jgi:signal transduction histidine kinase